MTASLTRAAVRYARRCDDDDDGEMLTATLVVATQPFQAETMTEIYTALSYG